MERALSLPGRNCRRSGGSGVSVSHGAFLYLEVLLQVVEVELEQRASEDVIRCRSEEPERLLGDRHRDWVQPADDALVVCTRNA